MTLLIIYLALAIGVSFICSILEAVLLSVSDAYIARLEFEGQPHGSALRDMKEDIDRPLATILSLNTIAHTVGAAGVGAQAQVVFGSAYLGVISGVLTFLILVFSEIIPKTLGARFWRQLAYVSVKTLQVLMVVLAPLVWFCKQITNLLGEQDHSISFSKEEFAAMADRGAEQGIFAENEVSAVKNLVFFESLAARDVMTPRTVVAGISSESKVKDYLANHEELAFSRLPVYHEHKEDIQGFALRSDILMAAAQGKHDVAISEFRRDLLVVPDKTTLKEVFEKLVQRKEQIAALVDEYGGFTGVVTIEDIVETLLGLEIMDEDDKVEDMQHLAKELGQQRGQRTDIEEENKP